MTVTNTTSPLTISRITVAAVGFLLLVKLTAYVMSGSTSVLSSLMDSVVDIGLSTLTLLALTWSAKPKDDDHRHGHGKIEGVSALLQAAFMMGAASFLVLESVSRLLNPEPITHHMLAAAMMGIAVVVSFLISHLQNAAVKQTGSVALKADHAHYSTDIYLNGAVFNVVVLDWFGLAPFWLDPLSGIAIAALFARTAYGIAREAIDHLMDREIEGEIRDNIIEAIKTSAGILEFHDLRVTGMHNQTHGHLFISVDIEVDAALNIKDAHDIGRNLEHKLVALYPRAEVFIHIDPEGDTHDTRH